MNIGSAKVTLDQRNKIPHHMIDICDIKDDFNVVKFHGKAHSICNEIIKRNKTPIIVGGSGFYIQNFLYGPPKGPPANLLIRKRLEEEINNLGINVLYEKLQKLDPIYAKTITKNDKNKIIRALEIIQLTNNKVSSFSVNKSIDNNYDYRCWFLYLPQDQLNTKIEIRCKTMIRQGLISEVQALIKQGLIKNKVASQAIGYKQCIEFLSQEPTDASRQQFLEKFIKASKDYSKKQITWFKNKLFFRWLNLDKIGYEVSQQYIIKDFNQK